MRKYLESSGCKGYVLGISGGIDSALMASLCCKAVGKGKLIGIYLPCESSLTMAEDSLQLAENLGIELRASNLIGSYNAIIQKLEDLGLTYDASFDKCMHDMMVGAEWRVDGDL